MPCCSCGPPTRCCGMRSTCGGMGLHLQDSGVLLGQAQQGQPRRHVPDAAGTSSPAWAFGPAPTRRHACSRAGASRSEATPTSPSCWWRLGASIRASPTRPTQRIERLVDGPYLELFARASPAGLGPARQPGGAVRRRAGADPPAAIALGRRRWPQINLGQPWPALNRPGGRTFTIARRFTGRSETLRSA